MHVYDVPLELKIFIFGGFAVASLALFGFVWYANWKARRKNTPAQRATGKKPKRKLRVHAR